MSNLDTSMQELWEKMRQSKEALRTQDASLKSGDGGGTYTGMSIIDAKIAAAEARTDTKFAQVLARLDAIEKSTSGLRLNVWLAAATALGLGIAAMAFGASQFGNGIMVTTASVQEAMETKRIAQENADEVRALRSDFSAFIKVFEAAQKQSEAPSP